MVPAPVVRAARSIGSHDSDARDPILFFFSEFPLALLFFHLPDGVWLWFLSTKRILFCSAAVPIGSIPFSRDLAPRYRGQTVRDLVRL